MKRICHLTKDTVAAFRAPDGFSPEPLTDLLRQGARDLIAQAVEAGLNAFLMTHADQTDAAGRRRLVRHGHLPERGVQTGIGAVPVPVPVKVPVPRVRDRAPEGGRLKFTSTLLPPCLRRAKSIEDLLPWLYLQGEEDQKTIRGTVFATRGPVISPRPSRPCWNRMRRACRPAPSPDRRRIGGTIANVGPSAICQRGAMCVSGPTVFASAPEWTRLVNASW